MKKDEASSTNWFVVLGHSFLGKSLLVFVKCICVFESKTECVKKLCYNFTMGFLVKVTSDYFLRLYFWVGKIVSWGTVIEDLNSNVYFNSQSNAKKKIISILDCFC